MIEKIVLDYLNTSDLGVTAYMQRPEAEPESYIVLQKTGSSRTDRIDMATFAVQSYAPTLYEAATLNKDVKAVMEDLAELDEIGRVKLVSDYNFTSSTAKRYRYQAVYNITHY